MSSDDRDTIQEIILHELRELKSQVTGLCSNVSVLKESTAHCEKRLDEIKVQVDKNSDNINKDVEKLDDRVDGLEKTKARASGIAAILGILGGGGISALLKFLLE